MRLISALLTCLAVLALALVAGGLLLGDHEDTALAADPTPVPTVTPGRCPEPTSTPAPSPTPTFFFPLTYLYVCNDTGVAASGLHLFVNNAASLSPLIENAPGCPAPRYEFNPPIPAPLYSAIKVWWDTDCVDPGETAVLVFGSDCPGCEATVGGYSWLFGTPTPTPTPTLAPWFTPIPTPGPDDCLPAPTPAPGANFLGVCSAYVEPGGSVTVAVTARLPGAAIGAWTIDVEFDDNLVTLTGCTSSHLGLCTTDYAPASARFVGATANGLTGDIVLGTLILQAGHEEGVANIDVRIAQLTTPQGQDISITATDGTITITSATPTPTPTPTPVVTPTTVATPTPTGTPTPAALPKTGGRPGTYGAPYGPLAALAGFGAFVSAAVWLTVKRRAPQGRPPRAP